MVERTDNDWFALEDGEVRVRTLTRQNESRTHESQHQALENGQRPGQNVVSATAQIALISRHIAHSTEERIAAHQGLPG